MVQEAARAMKTFGKRERDDTPTRLAALTPRRDEAPAEQPVMPAAPRERDGTPTRLPELTPRRDETPAEQPVMPAPLRQRVIEQIDPSVAATVSRDVLRRQIEEIIHGIANEQRLELSGASSFCWRTRSRTT